MIDLPCRIGVDGGGTKTECILSDAKGVIVARHTAPGCSPSFVGPDGARTILTNALQTLVARHPAPVIERVLLCMAGDRSFWEAMAASLRGFGYVETAGDYIPVLELATGGAPGLVLHAGTGSFIAARTPDGVIHYAGGLGWRFGDPGSGYDLGRRALARAQLEMQGWAQRTALADALVKSTGLTDYPANSHSFYADPEANARIAAFAAQVVGLAEQGCESARQVITESLGDFAKLVNAVLQRLFSRTSARSPVPCGVSGKLLNRPLAMDTLQTLKVTHAWPVQLQRITEPPIEGVRRLLRQTVPIL